MFDWSKLKWKVLDKKEFAKFYRILKQNVLEQYKNQYFIIPDLKEKHIDKL